MFSGGTVIVRDAMRIMANVSHVSSPDSPPRFMCGTYDRGLQSWRPVFSSPVHFDQEV